MQKFGFLQTPDWHIQSPCWEQSTDITHIRENGPHFKYQFRNLSIAEYDCIYQILFLWFDEPILYYFINRDIVLLDMMFLHCCGP